MANEDLMLKELDRIAKKGGDNLFKTLVRGLESKYGKKSFKGNLVGEKNPYYQDVKSDYGKEVADALLGGLRTSASKDLIQRAGGARYVSGLTREGESAIIDILAENESVRDIFYDPIKADNPELFKEGIIRKDKETNSSTEDMDTTNKIQELIGQFGDLFKARQEKAIAGVKDIFAEIDSQAEEATVARGSLVNTFLESQKERTKRDVLSNVIGGLEESRESFGRDLLGLGVRTDIQKELAEVGQEYDIEKMFLSKDIQGDLLKQKYGLERTSNESDVLANIGGSALLKLGANIFGIPA